MELKDYSGLFTITRTMSYRAIPVGNTAQTLRETGLLEQDRSLNDAYVRIKGYIGIYNAACLESLLSSAQDPDNKVIAKFPKVWEELDAAYEAIGHDGSLPCPDEAASKLLDAFDMLERLVKPAFVPTKVYNIKDDVLSALPKDMVRQADKDFDLFEKKNTRFSGFVELRNSVFHYNHAEFDRNANIESHTVIHRTAVANFSKYRQNAKRVKAACEHYPERIKAAEKSLEKVLEGRKIEEIFDIASYNRYLAQSGIDFYNTVIGGYVDEDGSKVKGLNEHLNEGYSQSKDEEGSAKPFIKLLRLWKQVLSIPQSFSLKPEGIESDEQLADGLLGFAGELNAVRCDLLDESIPAADLLIKAFDDAAKHPEKIIIPKKKYQKISSILCDGWDSIGRAIEYCQENAAGPTKDIAKKPERAKFARNSATLEDIYSACQACGIEIDLGMLAERARKVKHSMQQAEGGMRRALSQAGGKRQLCNMDEECLLIKNWLDEVVDLARLGRLLTAPADIQGVDAYLILEDANEVLSKASRTYDKARNWLTRKPYSNDKYPLSFSRESLFSGWDKAKEDEYGNLILERDGIYYLAIVPFKRSAQISNLFIEDDQAEDAYIKHNFKLIKDATKTFPLVFIKSKKGRERHNTPQYLIDGYEKKAHLQMRDGKENPDFDPKFLEKLIGFIMSNVKNQPGWDVFDFSEIKKPAEYGRWIEFCNDINRAGYTHWTYNVAADAIDEAVENGDVLMFKIWNHDFDATHSAPDHIPTVLLNAVMGKEDTDVRISGGAELFFRPASIKDPFVHRKGSYVVNKTYTDENGIRHRLPEKIHREIYLEANGRLHEGLSKEAKKYKKLVRITKLDRDIVKDRIHTEDVFEFHLPYSINPTAGKFPSITQDVRAAIEKDGTNIIGVKRGINDLVYVTVIDFYGNILEERSLNIIGGVDYYDALTLRERERDEAQASWSAQDKIANLKSNYIGNAISEIAGLAVKYNAIIAVEDVDVAFANGMGKFERNVYKSFVLRLATKLTCLVDPQARNDSRLGCPMQLSRAVSTYDELYGQSGILFNANPTWTSAYDPTTGYAPLAAGLLKYRSVAFSKDLLNAFERFSYDAEKEAFFIDVRHSDIAERMHLPQRKSKQLLKDARLWRIWIDGVVDWRHKDRKSGAIVYDAVDLGGELARLFEEYGIEYKDGKDLIGCFEPWDKRFFFRLLGLISLGVSMVYYTKDGKSYVKSPVESEDGKRYRTGDAKRPSCAAAHGAFCIALRARLSLIGMERKEDGKYALAPTGNERWLTPQID